MQADLQGLEISRESLAGDIHIHLTPEAHAGVSMALPWRLPHHRAKPYVGKDDYSTCS